jgi:hypothetical protein
MKRDIFKVIMFASIYNIIGIVLMVNVLFAFSPAEGQDLKNVKVTMTTKDATFEQAIKLLEKKTDFVFTYHVEEIPLNEKVTIDVSNESLYEILHTLASQYGLLFQRINNQIVIKKDESLEKKGVEVIESTGSIKGKITDMKSGEPLIGVIIKLNNTKIGTTSDIQGNYRISNIPPGNYTILADYVGYERGEVSNIEIKEDSEKPVDFKLKEKSVLLSEITVTPGAISIMGSATPARQTLKKDEITKVTMLEDIYRSIRRLPGITSNDYSAKFNVRGGESDEILVTLDGLEVYEPFHMKDCMGGLLSVIDLNTIGGVNLFSGGFTAEYGNKMSGVFDIKTQNVKDNETTLSAGISMMNARLTTTGTFNDNKGSWLLSARRGYLDLVFSIVDEEHEMPSPVYYDILGKIKYKLNENHSLALNFLLADDKIKFTEDDKDYSEGGYGNNYVWITINSNFSSKFFVQTIFAAGEISHRKKGMDYSGDLEYIKFEVKDNRDFSMARLKQDCNYGISENMYLKWGFDLTFGKSSYDYSYYWNRRTLDSNNQNIMVQDRDNINIKPSGNQYGIYLSDKMRIIEPLALELGIRYDYVSYISKGFISPRVNFAYAFNNRTSLRFGWGYFYQPEELFEISYLNGETGFNEPELSKHWLIGFEHFFSNGFNLRLEAYYKDISNQRMEYRDLYNQVNPLKIFRQFSDEIMNVSLDNSVAKGIELYLKYDKGEKFSGWFSYILSYKDDKIKQIKDFYGVNSIYNRYFPGINDQRHTVNLDLSYKLSEDLDINLAWQYHTGWPYNDQYVAEGIGNDGKKYQYLSTYEYLSQRLPDYSRVDIRISKYFNTSIGRMTLFLEIINLFNEKNLRSYEYTTTTNNNNELVLSKEANNWFPLLPSIGINWEMN